MQSHQASDEDRQFRLAFEACTIAPSEFNHQAHVRLAYIYLTEGDADSAIQKMRDALAELSRSTTAFRARSFTKR